MEERRPVACSDSSVVTQSKRAVRVRTNARGLCDSRNCVGDRRAPEIPSGIGRLFVACFKCSQCVRAACSWPAPRLTTCSNCASEERLRRPRTARRRYTGSLHLWIRAIEQRCTCLFPAKRRPEDQRETCAGNCEPSTSLRQACFQNLFFYHNPSCFYLFLPIVI